MKYTYKRELFFKNKLAEVAKVTLKPGEETPIHQHGPNCSGLIKILKGRVSETTYCRENRSWVVNGIGVYKAGEAIIEEGLGVHKISNTGRKPAIMLLLYSPPAVNTEIKLT